ncbi:hypothetical protein ACQEV4_00155 [Streptomyces shenzhenensis]|uniref:hypothetical protein n=1 Tax=Streptomyces shenzhenensis TaxID=943815 RepID=UPI0033DAB87C
MLNRIRRALSHTRVRNSSRGRHRRPLLLTPTRRTAADASTIVLGRASTVPDHRQPLRGEDVALVRPYVLAWEGRVRARPVVIASHLPADAWSALAGVR